MKAKTILEQQTLILTMIRRCLNYLMKFDLYREEFRVEQSGHASTYVIYRDFVIINFFKLLNSKKEHYSFQSLIHHIEDPTLRLELLKEFSALKKLYQELKIYQIRNQHIGHLDFERQKATISWEDTKQLLENCESLHDKINLSLFETQTDWAFEEDKLADLLVDRSVRMNLVNLYRKSNRERKSSIDLKEIREIITTTTNQN